MKIENLLYKKDSWEKETDTQSLLAADLVFVFGDADEFEKSKHYNYLRDKYPDADIIGCSSSGNILGGEISQSSVVATAVSFDKATTSLKSVVVNKDDDIEQLSKDLALQFDTDGLKHVFILADGLKINGSAVIRGFNEALSDVTKTGGMAGDGERYQKTYVMANGIAKESVIAAVGFYGDSLHIGNGSQGGWSEFGVARVITKSEGNILYELEGESILDYYEKYVGDYTDSIESAGLRFPISVKENEKSDGVIRTLFGVNTEDKSITFAGDVPEGHLAQLMKLDIDLFISSAADAAREAKIDNKKIALGLTVSCTGRKAVMGEMIDEEIDVMKDELGEKIQLVGFYAYGELAPLKSNSSTCILHNQTMTLTVIYEE